MTHDNAPPALPPHASATFQMLVQQRRDVRNFQTGALDEADLAWCFKMANCAPSVGLSQPWRFVRILSEPLRECLACHVDEQKAKAGARYNGKRGELYDRLKLHGLREAPVIFAAFCDEETEKGQQLGATTMPESRRYSCVMAIHTLWLAARTRGIGMGWISILDPAFVRRELDVPETWSPLGLLCLGRPVHRIARPELERAGWESITAWEQHILYR